MSKPQPMSELTAGREEPCPRCDNRFHQININGAWWPKEHPKCPNAIPDPRAANRDEDGALTLRLKQRSDEQLREIQAGTLNAPPLYREVTLGNFNCTTASHARIVERAKEFCEWWPERADLTRGFPHVVLMVGPSGTGKNHIAWSIARQVAEAVLPNLVKVAKCGDIIRDLRQSWNGNAGESEISRLNYYRELELLVIDEVSSHALYGEPSRHLYDLVDHRQEWLRPTILTSNEDAAGIAALLGPALVSRAAGWGGVWKFEGEDYRLKMRKLRAL